MHICSFIFEMFILELSAIIAEEDLRVEAFNLAQFLLQIAPIHLSIIMNATKIIPYHFMQLHV